MFLRLAKIEDKLAHIIERIEDIETKQVEQNTTVGKNVSKGFLIYKAMQLST